LLRLRHRRRRLRVPALLLHGADRLGGQTATRAPAAEGRQCALARRGGRAARYVSRRTLPRAAGLRLRSVVRRDLRLQLGKLHTRVLFRCGFNRSTAYSSLNQLPWGGSVGSSSSNRYACCLHWTNRDTFIARAAVGE